VSTEPDSTPDKSAVLILPAPGTHDSRLGVAVLGLKVSRGSFLKDRYIQSLVSNQFLELAILLLQLLQPLSLIQTKTTVLLAPTIVSLLTDTELLADLSN
jgi:hypothetical protein